MAALGYLSKLKTSLGLVFPYLILYQWIKFECLTFFLSDDIKQNLLLSSYLDN